MEEFLKDWLKAWTGNQPEKLLSFYHEDCFYRDPAFPKGLHGKTAMRDYFTKLLAKNPDWKWELISWDMVDDGKMYMKWKATIPVRGKVIEEEGLDIVIMRNGKIIRNEVYFDTRSML